MSSAACRRCRADGWGDARGSQDKGGATPRSPPRPDTCPARPADETERHRRAGRHARNRAGSDAAGREHSSMQGSPCCHHRPHLARNYLCRCCLYLCHATHQKAHLLALAAAAVVLAAAAAVAAAASAGGGAAAFACLGRAAFNAAGRQGGRKGGRQRRSHVLERDWDAWMSVVRACPLATCVYALHNSSAPPGPRPPRARGPPPARRG